MQVNGVSIIYLNKAELFFFSVTEVSQRKGDCYKKSLCNQQNELAEQAGLGVEEMFRVSFCSKALPVIIRIIPCIL